MHKLVILVESSANMETLEAGWPQFLSQAERMPGLVRESTSWVGPVLHGKFACSLVHELYFDSLESARQAMASPQGQAADRTLQAITGGHVILFTAEHMEEKLESLQPAAGDAPTPPAGSAAL